MVVLVEPGGGEEMGGIRGIKHYLQRTMIQGHPTTITNLTKQYQVGQNKTQKVHILFENILRRLKLEILLLLINIL